MVSAIFSAVMGIMGLFAFLVFLILSSCALLSILYLDPPYENATLRGYSMKEFNSQPFYDWAYNMSKKNIVLISSYKISDERFEYVYEFKKARSTLQGGTNNDRTEKLFMVKKGVK